MLCQVVLAIINRRFNQTISSKLVHEVFSKNHNFLRAEFYPKKKSGVTLNMIMDR